MSKVEIEVETGDIELEISAEGEQEKELTVAYESTIEGEPEVYLMEGNPFDLPEGEAIIDIKFYDMPPREQDEDPET